MALPAANLSGEAWGDTGEVDDPLRTVPDSEDYCPLVRYSGAPGIRLSWPNAGDGRRAVVGKSPSPRKGNRDTHVHVTGIVHVSHRDIEMHYHRTGSAANGRTLPILDIPLGWNSIKLEVGNQDLLQYFQRAASRSLATFGHDSTELGNILIKIALASNTASATAVLQSLLALSALHCHGVHRQAFELKISALEALNVASRSDNIGTTETIQHVAAGMLLCYFEIHQASCTSGDWTRYLCGVKNIIRTAGLDKIHQDSDLAILLDWVYYHDVLARFSIRHWHREPRVKSLTSSSVASSSSGLCPTRIRSEASQAAPPALALIELLSEVSDAVSPRPTAIASAQHIGDHTSFLKILDWRIRSMAVVATTDDSADMPLVMEVYQLAMLVYLNRASENVLNQGIRTQEQIDKAFAIFTRLGSCDQQFPVFILGCEARSDDQRAVILDLISRTEKGISSRSFNYVRVLLQAIWAQEDLATGGINYWDKLTYVISCCRTVPTFV